MANKIDIDVQPINRGVFDIAIDPDTGDLVTTNGFNTSLKMALFEERRADASEIVLPENRRGWWGNELFDEAEFEIGSKLWELYQVRLTQETLQKALDFVRQALQWMIDDGHVDSVEVSGFIKRNETIILTIKLFRGGNLVESRSFDIWSATLLEKSEFSP